MRLRKSFWLLPLLVLSCVFLLTAAIPNVPTGTWQTWNAMGDARSGAAAVLLQDGRMLIVGGNNAIGPAASADLFGTDGSFSAAALMQTPRSGHTATVLSDGRVLVAGGITTGGGAVNTAEIYDPNANSWSAPATMVNARSGHTASLLSDGRVLLGGGHDSSGNALSSLEIFDPTSGAFTSAGAMSSPRMNFAAATLGDGRVLLIGGTADGTNALNSIDIYDPSTGMVSAGPTLSVARISATATTTLDGKVAVIGGNNGSASGSQDLASAEIFDTATGQLSLSASNLATARSGHQAFLLPKNNAILVLGGSSSGNDLNSAELYYSWADTFQATSSMSVPRPGLVGSATSQDGVFLAAGGTNLSSTELYGFATVKTDAADYPPGSTVTITGSGWQPGETVTLTLVESPLIDTHGPYTTVADANGNISNSSFVTDDHDLSIRFYLTAVGSASQWQAQNTFTDSNITNVIVAAQSPSPVVAGNAATFNPVTVNFGGNTTACTVTFSTSALPAGASASFSPTSVTGASNNTPKTSVLTINTTTGLAAGTYTFTVTANVGSGCNGGSATSSNVTLTVQNSTNLSVSSVTGVFGQTVNLSATLTSGSPAVGESGQTVNFTLNGNAAGGATTNSSGVASRTASLGTIAPGTYATGVGASFTTNGPILGSTGSAQLIVSQANTTTSITNGAALGTVSVVGQAYAVNYSVAVTAPSAGTPTGTVTVSDGTSNCTGTVAAGTCSLTSTSPGAKTITASYGGDTNFIGSTSSGTPHTVTAANTTTNLTSSLNPSVFSQSVTFTAAVTVNSPGTGTIPANETVTFKDGAATIGTGTTNASGVATFATSTLTAGTHSITAVYAGDTNFATSTSTAVSQVVNKRATTTSVSLSLTTVVVGQATSANVTVTDTDAGVQTNPTGTVTLSSSDAGDSFGTCTLAPSGGNAATCSTSVTPSKVGSSPHTITATFPTDTTHATSSGNASLTVNKANTTTTISSNTPNPSTVGQSVTINYSVAVTAPGTGTPTGNVTVSDGAGDACTALASAGTCSITFATAGTKTLTATYAGDSNFVTSSSAGTSQTVNPKLAINSTAFAILTGTCSSQVTVQTQNNDGSGANQTPARTLNLSSSSGTGKFFGDAACSNQITTANIATGTSTAGFYYDDASIGTPLITVASTGLSSVTQTEASTGLRFSNAAFSVQVNSCSPALTLQSANAQNGTPTSLTQATTINLSSTSAGGKFYSDAACTTQIASTTISPAIDAGHDSPNFYYEDTSAGGPTITAAAGTASAQQAESIVTAPSISKAFGAPSIPVNGTTSLTLTITNPAANTVALTGLAVTDNLPSGMVVATPNGLTNTCGGTATATPGSGSVSLGGGTVAANNSCKVTVNVTGTTSGVKNNTTGAVTSANGGTGNTALASLTVASPPTISKAFGAASIPLNASTSLTFTISNPNTIGLTGVAFTDTLPAGLVVSTPSNLNSSCGTVTAAAGSGSVSLSGGTVASSGSCTISVNVTGTTTGVKNNTTSVISATESGSGAASNTASLTVNTRATSTSIAPLTATAPIGQGTNFTITVTDTDSGPASTPTGSVAVSSVSVPSNTDSIGACTLAQTVVGTASCMVTVTPTAPSGTHTISASFTANDNGHSNSSTTNSAALTVTNPATSTTLMSSPNPSTFGQLVNFSATVGSAAGTPTGSVTFNEGSCFGNLLAGPTGLDVNGQASFQTSTLSAGVHDIFACYTPIGIYLASSSDVIQQVNQATVTVSTTGGPFTYDGNAHGATIMLSPSITGYTVNYAGATTGYNSSSAPTNADTYTVTVTITDPNYMLSGSGTGSITINTQPLYVVASDGSRAFGDGNPTFTPTFMGLVNGDTPSSVGSVTCTSAANSTSAPGTYATTCSGVTSSNYSVHYINGTLTITNPLTAITTVTDTQGGTIQIGQMDQLTATGQFADSHTRTLASAGGLSFTRADMGTPVYGAAVAEAGGVLYAIGGTDGSNTVLNTIHAYNPKTNTWNTISAPLTTARTNAAVASAAGKIYVIGGNDASNSPLASIEVLDTTVASPAVSAFASSLTTARNNAAAAVWNQKLYVIGGSDGPLSSVEIFDLVTGNVNTGNTGTQMAQASAAVVPTSPASTLYVVGTSGSSVVVLSTTGGSAWTSASAVPGGLDGTQGVGAVSFNGLLYIVNGANVWSYDGTAFTQQNSLGNAHNGSQPAAIGSRIYVASVGSGSLSAKLDAFAPAEVTRSSADNNKATIDQSGNVTAVGRTDPGTVTLTATSLADNNISKDFLLTVIRKSQTITFGTLSPATYGDPDFMVSASASSGLAVTFAAAGNCTVSGSTVHITGAGSCTITAQQGGDPITWAPAPDVPQTFSIAKAMATVVVTPYTSPGTTYTGLPHTAAVTSISGVNGETGATVGTVDVSNTTHTPAGTYASDSWFFTGAANYNNIGNTTITDSIAKATAMVVVTPYTVTYDGNPHTATITSITGVNGEMGATVGTVDVSNTTHTPAGTYASDYWFFTGAANYNNIGNTTITDTINKATPIVTWVNPANITYGTALSGTQLNATFTWVVSGSTVTVGGTATYSPASGTVLIPGQGQILSVSFTPSDSTNYTNASKTVTINVMFASASSGLCDGDLSHTILQPINADGTSVFKTGSTVPTKFRVCDAFGNSVGPTTAFPNVVKSYNIVGTYGSTITNVDESVSSTTPDIAFRWDPTAQQWIFNTATGAGTSLSSKNVTYLFQIVLIDGTIIGSSGTGGVIPSAPFAGYNGYQYGLK